MLARISRVVSTTRHPVAIVAGSGLSVFLVAYFLGDVAGHARITETLRNVRPEWFVLCLVAGLRMLSGGDRAMGLGLLIGWVLGAAGTAALVVWAYQSLLDH